MGNGSTGGPNYPPTVVQVSPGRAIKEVGCGATHVCAIDDLNQLFCWGFNYYGQVGDGTFTTTSPYARLRPVQITF